MKKINNHTFFSLGCLFVGLVGSSVYQVTARASSTIVEPIQACVISGNAPLNNELRLKIAQCLHWKNEPYCHRCDGYYELPVITPISDQNEIHLAADSVSFSAKGSSHLKGHVEIKQSQRIVTAHTANVYRDAKTNHITSIELIGQVTYLEPDKVMLAKKATIHPLDKSGTVEDALYLFKTDRAQALLPAWGRAAWIQRFKNKNYLLNQASYTTCAPKDKAWEVKASQITLDHAKQTGVARNAILSVADLPLIYTPYLSFPTSKARKSGFLMPLVGYNNVSGFDYAFPYYLNLAPNYDATIAPHVYTFRGLMLGGDTRFLTPNSSGVVGASFLPGDKAFRNFLTENRDAFPVLQGVSNNRWAVTLREDTHLTDHLNFHVNYQQVSDDYYLQDFSTNLAIATENQLLRQGDVSYVTDHWLFNGMLQSYQTLHPINQSAVANIYQRLPQLSARGRYDDLPFNLNFNMLGQFDYFHWTGNELTQPQGPRYHANPILTMPWLKPWAYFTPEIQLVENYYSLSSGYSMINAPLQQAQSFNRTIPRFSVDSGLTFERNDTFRGHAFMQTLEPRLYYLNVPYQNQSEFPSFDSAYMIFNTDQLFRNNRFSGFDRIGDANQLAYAATSRWISSRTGRELGSLTVEPNFSEFEAFLYDEFKTCVLIAYDEFCTTIDYKKTSLIYTLLNIPQLSYWLDNVIKDEARHCANSIKLIRCQHKHRLSETPKVIEQILTIEQSLTDYNHTFFLDHADGTCLLSFEEMKDQCAQTVLKSIMR